MRVVIGPIRARRRDDQRSRIDEATLPAPAIETTDPTSSSTITKTHARRAASRTAEQRDLRYGTGGAKAATARHFASAATPREAGHTNKVMKKISRVRPAWRWALCTQHRACRSRCQGKTPAPPETPIPAGESTEDTTWHATNPTLATFTPSLSLHQVEENGNVSSIFRVFIVMS